MLITRQFLCMSARNAPQMPNINAHPTRISYELQVGPKLSIDDIIMEVRTCLYDLQCRCTPTYPFVKHFQGILGLQRAIEKFEPERGLAFSTYASIWYLPS